jgi:hypothetical protein
MAKKNKVLYKMFASIGKAYIKDVNNKRKNLPGELTIKNK